MPKEHEANFNNGISNFGDVKGLPRDRPWLLPSNRKLRHLQGVSLRNLSLSTPRARTRGKTIDDESLPYSLKTPAKLLAQRETPKLEHSRSSTDLKSPPKINGKVKDEVRRDSSTKVRPIASKLRRRSTLNWSGAPPRVRQNKLEDVIQARMADTWFSLHCAGLGEPVYVSEVVEKAMNPTFRDFDLNIYGPLVTRQDDLKIKYWAKTEKHADYILLVELQVCLRSLQYIGKSLENFNHPLPQNCILLHLADGIYTSFTDLPLEEPVLAISQLSKHSQATSSFDALMRLSNLDDCIQDALATREQLTGQISKLLEEHAYSLDAINKSSQAQQSVTTTQQSLARSRKALKTVQSRRSELRASLESRRHAISSGNLTQEKAQSNLTSARSDLISLRTFLNETKSAVNGQTRRICEDLLRIYPIEPIKEKPLSFTIRRLHLSNAASSTDPEKDSAVMAAALGHVAHVIYLLSLYLLTPIPYPSRPHGSTSTITDPISTNMPSAAARVFPLYQKGAVAYRFEYGVFLLNSDIELLMGRQGLRMVDLRHTLPNLKYLLTVLTTGKGELPTRKRPGPHRLNSCAERTNDAVAEKGKEFHANGKPAELKV